MCDSTVMMGEVENAVLASCSLLLKRVLPNADASKGKVTVSLMCSFEIFFPYAIFALQNKSYHVARILLHRMESQETTE